MALAGRATTTIELGTSVLQTYTCHPVLQANRAASTAAAMGRPGLTLGVGPSHQPVIEGMFGLSYDDAGAPHRGVRRRCSPRCCAARPSTSTATHFRVNIPAAAPRAAAGQRDARRALAPRLLRVAGELTDGTILWMGNARCDRDPRRAAHHRPRPTAAGRPAPRIVAGLPVAVHDDVDEAARDRGQALRRRTACCPNYRRILDIGGAAGPADAAIVGDEAAVTAQIQALFDAGATDVWAAPFPVGDDRLCLARAAPERSLKELANA